MVEPTRDESDFVRLSQKLAELGTVSDESDFVRLNQKWLSKGDAVKRAIFATARANGRS